MKQVKKILIIAPLPPPITGQSLTYQLFLEKVAKHYKVEVINFNKGSLKQGLSSFRRISEVLKISYVIWIKVKDVGLIYLTFRRLRTVMKEDIKINSVNFVRKFILMKKLGKFSCCINVGRRHKFVCEY